MTFSDYFYKNFLTTPRRRKLPQNVIGAINERERANEILARIIQLAIVSIFLFIYSVSPKTGTNTAFNPVPWVLGAYLSVSIVGLIWSLKTRLPDWSVYVSILFDFAMLYGLMISFHIQYMQPASFILKAPALLYVFIFIALRVLRLESKFVISAGIVAAVGWLAMIIYVTEIDPGDNMLTRSYVEYLTSNTILIGAEVDKILSIIFVTTVLALAVNGSANLLVTAVTEQRAATALSRFFDTSVADEIRTTDSALKAGAGTKVNAAIVNIDIRGFTTLAATMPADDVMRALSLYQSQLIPIIHKHGGIIDKFMGDGILATFGLAANAKPNACALDAMNAVEEILVDVSSWPSKDNYLKQISQNGIGIGLAGGEVSYGAVGDEDRLEMTVIGSAVNFSAKLEKHNKVLGSRCIVAANLYQAALSQGYSGALTGELIMTDVEGVPDHQKVAVLDLRSERLNAG